MFDVLGGGVVRASCLSFDLLGLQYLLGAQISQIECQAYSNRIDTLCNVAFGKALTFI